MVLLSSAGLVAGVAVDGVAVEFLVDVLFVVVDVLLVEVGV